MYWGIIIKTILPSSSCQFFNFRYQTFYQTDETFLAYNFLYLNTKAYVHIIMKKLPRMLKNSQEFSRILHTMIKILEKTVSLFEIRVHKKLQIFSKNFLEFFRILRLEYHVNMCRGYWIIVLWFSSATNQPLRF